MEKYILVIHIAPSIDECMSKMYFFEEKRGYICEEEYDGTETITNENENLYVWSFRSDAELNNLYRTLKQNPDTQIDFKHLNVRDIWNMNNMYYGIQYEHFVQGYIYCSDDGTGFYCCTSGTYYSAEFLRMKDLHTFCDKDGNYFFPEEDNMLCVANKEELPPLTLCVKNLEHLPKYTYINGVCIF